MKNPLTFRRLVALQIAIVSLILYFGLLPKGLTVDNQVQWLEAGGGIRIGEYGMAFADIAPLAPEVANAGAFTIEFAVRAATDVSANFKSLLMVHSGSDTHQLIVGQWKSALIVMNGDDYDNSRRLKRIIAKGSLTAGDTRLVSVVSRRNSTEVYVDGRLAARHQRLALDFPQGGQRVYLVIGNSVYGTNTWNGEVRGLGIYAGALDARQIARRHEQWSRAQRLAVDPKIPPLLLYAFNPSAGRRVTDMSASNIPLQIPARVTTLEQTFLAPPWHQFRFNMPAVVDIVLNLLGFIPMGWITWSMLDRGSRLGRTYNALVAVVACVGLSLLIESIQMWMPSRSSSLLDLALNSTGGAFGVGIGLIRDLPGWWLHRKG